jgi:RND family efflux transporter MFP subunit
MFRKYALPLVALLGILIALAGVLWTARKIPPSPILFPPPNPPYANYIGGEGIIEASTDNIAIGTPYNEIVTDVYVGRGQKVKEGDPLFKLDVQTLEAELYQAEMDRDYAIVEYENQKAQLDLYDRLTDRRAISELNYTQVYYAAEAAKVAIAQAEARILTAQTFITRSTIRAPFDGTVLQINLHVGETANLNPFNNLPLMVFGPVSPMQVRIYIDEDDAWRYEKGSAAVAYVRGNSSICFPLKFVRLEPLLVAKTSLTGEPTERVDTRVLQVIYAFDREDSPVYAGQLLDIYIDSIPADTRYRDAKNRCR